MRAIRTEVLLRVTAAGVHPLDWKTRSRGVFLGCPPLTVGSDVVGVVGDPVRGDTGVRALPAIPDGGLEGLAALAGAGALRAPVARTVQLEQAARAHRMGETGRARWPARHRRRMTSRSRPAGRRGRKHRIQGATDG